MKIAIVYSSNTGNTKIIAEAIKEELSNEDIVYFGKPENNIEADIYIVGSWTDKGNCSSEIKEFLTKLNYKKVPKKQRTRIDFKPFLFLRHIVCCL